MNAVHKKAICIGAAVVVGMSLCSFVAAESAAYKKISPSDAKKELGIDAKILLIDVRTQREYDEKHIAGSILIPLDTIAADAGKIIPDRNAKLFVYCRSGHRSRLAVQKLLGLGYTRVFDLGGIINWPYGTVSGK